MKRLFLALATVFCLSSAASAATLAVATGNVNLRAGPSTAYPVVTTVPAGVQVTTHGCLAGYTWCDISMGAYRGWVAATYIQVVYRGAPVVLTPAVAPTVGLTVVTFNKVYWDTYYAAYPWYGRWTYYAPRPVYPVAPAARVTSYNGSVQCANGSCTAARSATGIYGGSASQSRTCSGGACTSTRSVTGPYGASASRTRSCSGNTQSCTVTRTGPAGNSGTRTFTR
ncbi:SH3 domain-containing protein [Xanthobacter dioxanivorans]|uniref:SH3 domain-containing protein n=1 Tax=Xanthobacter dioxanivorans TaxID=2528964 RepID=A0A974SKN0_9HYPH|nr:SH3 domain-containing protein [Xanthobacter dioxanivorans]QRG09010.1 SH3 domain-containing protein [Xanthobacter dioxanivorans]